MECCLFCNNTTPLGFCQPGVYLHAPGVWNSFPTYKTQLENHLKTLHESPFHINHNYKILRLVIFYHRHCIRFLFNHFFGSNPPSLTEFQQCMDNLIPQMECPRMVTISPILVRSDEPSDDPQQIEDNFRMVILSWLFSQHFGGHLISHNISHAVGTRCDNVAEFLEIVWKLNGLMDAFLGMVHFVMKGLEYDVDGELILDLGDRECVSVQVSPILTDVCLAAEYQQRIECLNDGDFDIQSLVVEMHLMIRLRRDLPTLFHPEKPDVFDILVGWINGDEELSDSE